MQNINVRREGTKAIIEVDLGQKLGPSKSGKTNLVANSGGFASIPGDGGFKLSMNVIAPK
jgi:hypothetical protein